jgi:hypothetical protein
MIRRFRPLLQPAFQAQFPGPRDRFGPCAATPTVEMLMRRDGDRPVPSRVAAGGRRGLRGINRAATFPRLHPLFSLPECIISCIKSPVLPNPVRSRRAFRPGPGPPFRVSVSIDEFRPLDFPEERLRGPDDSTAF